MAADVQTNTPDPLYDLVGTLYHALKQAAAAERHAADADQGRDAELAALFRDVREQSLDLAVAVQDAARPSAGHVGVRHAAHPGGRGLEGELPRERRTGLLRCAGLRAHATHIRRHPPPAEAAAAIRSPGGPAAVRSGASAASSHQLCVVALLAPRLLERAGPPHRAGPRPPRLGAGGRAAPDLGRRGRRRRARALGPARAAHRDHGVGPGADLGTLRDPARSTPSGATGPRPTPSPSIKAAGLTPAEVLLVRARLDRASAEGRQEVAGRSRRHRPPARAPSGSTGCGWSSSSRAPRPSWWRARRRSGWIRSGAASRDRGR